MPFSQTQDSRLWARTNPEPGEPARARCEHAVNLPIPRYDTVRFSTPAGAFREARRATAFPQTGRGFAESAEGRSALACTLCEASLQGPNRLAPRTARRSAYPDRGREME